MGLSYFADLHKCTPFSTPVPAWQQDTSERGQIRMKGIGAYRTGPE